MNLIISDNSPLNVLIRLGVVDILVNLFGQVIIPPEVAREMTHAKAPKPVQDFIAAPPSWLNVVAPQKQLAFPNLDPGESAAISLAIERRATLLIDERQGREVAIAHGLQIIGAIGVLARISPMTF